VAEKMNNIPHGCSSPEKREVRKTAQQARIREKEDVPV
jgi:hypothetical protein